MTHETGCLFKVDGLENLFQKKAAFVKRSETNRKDISVESLRESGI
jgi:hypothetical protein